MFGVFQHRVVRQNENVLRGFDDVFFAPHSRHTEIRQADVEQVAEVQLLAVSDEAGVYLAASADGRNIYITGHSEYDRETLQLEYERDVQKGSAIKVPRNYYPGDDPTQPPLVQWRGHASLLYTNWLNYCVYQSTPFDLRRIAA